MTIREIVDLLGKMPPDLEVQARGEGEWYCCSPVATVEDVSYPARHGEVRYVLLVTEAGEEKRKAADYEGNIRRRRDAGS